MLAAHPATPAAPAEYAKPDPLAPAPSSSAPAPSSKPMELKAPGLAVHALNEFDSSLPSRMADLEASHLEAAEDGDGDGDGPEAEVPPRCGAVAFINPKSGGQMGRQAIDYIKALPEFHVFNLAEVSSQNPHDFRQQLRAVLGKPKRGCAPHVKVVVGGGDGTVTWVMKLLRSAIGPDAPLPPIAILPLGLGNELGRVTGWGHTAPKVPAFVRDVLESNRVIHVDQWHVSFRLTGPDLPLTAVAGTGELASDALVVQPRPIHPPSAGSPRPQEDQDEDDPEAELKGLRAPDTATTRSASPNTSGSSGSSASSPQRAASVPPVPAGPSFHSPQRMESTMNCFISMGFDAWIAYRFHVLRETRPDKCSSVAKNKMWHGLFGAQELFTRRPSIRQWLELRVDGVSVPIPHNIRTLQVFNIHSSADGTNFWGTGASCCATDPKEFKSPLIHDGLLEVCATKGVAHLSRVHLGLSNSFRVAQGREVEVVLKRAMAVQMDGEPWMQDPCVIRISHKGTQAILAGRQSKRHVDENQLAAFE